MVLLTEATPHCIPVLSVVAIDVQRLIPIEHATVPIEHATVPIEYDYHNTIKYEYHIIIEMGRLRLVGFLKLL